MNQLVPKSQLIVRTSKSCKGVCEWAFSTREWVLFLRFLVEILTSCVHLDVCIGPEQSVNVSHH